MVLNITDEVINGTPKYNITDNGDGTKSITLANEVVQSGTALNRNLFNKIENVLSYQIPSVEQRSTKPDYVGNFTPTSISPSWSANATIGKEITFNYNEQGGIQPILKYIASDTYPTFVAKSSLTSSTTTIATTTQYSTYYTSERCLETQQNIERDSIGSANVMGRGNDCAWFDMGEPCIPTFNSQISAGTYGSPKVYGSNDNINWEELGSAFGVKVITPSNPYRYFKFYDGNYSISIYYLFISNIKFGKANVYTLGNEITFANNERILINIPSSVTTSGVANNILNGIEIDELLEPSKYYELVYNQSQNKFIAQEVRN